MAGTWSTVLFAVAAMDITAAVCALVVLKPILRAHQARSDEQQGQEPIRSAASPRAYS
jgi:OFA family oxalate/formate antiporter-like MFS transporter